MKTTILIIEDNDIDREQIGRLLGSQYTLVEAATADEARKRLQAQQIDLVLLDYYLPDVIGLTLLEELASQKLPIILLTIVDAPDLIVKSLKRGALDYLLKENLTKQRLIQSIENTLQTARLQRETEAQQRLLVEQHEQIRHLAAEVTLAEQEERKRIAHLLHDHVQQMLYSAQMHLMMARSALQEGESPDETLGDLEQLLNSIVETTRSLSIELSPPILRDQSFAITLEWLVAHMRQQHNLRVRYAYRGMREGVMDDALRVMLFNAVRELLFNVVKHAGVREADLEVVDSAELVEITISDRGKGFDVDRLEWSHAKSFGLPTVRHRIQVVGGDLQARSATGEGTAIYIKVPLNGG